MGKGGGGRGLNPGYTSYGCGDRSLHIPQSQLTLCESTTDDEHFQFVVGASVPHQPHSAWQEVSPHCLIIAIVLNTGEQTNKQTPGT